MQILFLQDKNNHLNKPKILGTPQEAIKELLDYKLYDVSISLCLFPNTDIFLNGENISYLLETLTEIQGKNIKNTLVLITKCLIPKKVLEVLQQINEHYSRVYLSYYGLDNTIEPNVNHSDILFNFKNLKEYNIPTVHYYRPFIEENYATSGGSTTDREACLNKELYNWSSSSVSDCKTNNWLYNSDNSQWTLSPFSRNYAIIVNPTGFIGSNANAENPHFVLPALYLKSTVKITGGTGEKSNPFLLSE